MADSEERQALLKELGDYASADMVAREARLSTDQQIRDSIAAAKAQKAWYEDAGFSKTSVS